MLDLFYVAVVIVFFVLMWVLPRQRNGFRRMKWNTQ